MQTGELPALPGSYGNAKTILETPDHLTFVGQRASEAARGRAAVEALAQWLRRQVEPRSMRQIWAARVARVALAGVGLWLLIQVAVLLIWLTIRRH